MAARMKSHIRVNKLDEKFQSAYKEHHSTETAMTRIQNDVLCAVDQGNAVVLNDVVFSFSSKTLFCVKRYNSSIEIIGCSIYCFPS